MKKDNSCGPADVETEAQRGQIGYRWHTANKGWEQDVNSSNLICSPPSKYEFYGGKLQKERKELKR